MGILTRGHWARAVVIFILLMSINFFMSSNPYSTGHGGVRGVNDFWFIHIGWMTAFILAIWMIDNGSVKVFNISDFWLITIGVLMASIQTILYGGIFSCFFPYLSYICLYFLSKSKKGQIDFEIYSFRWWVWIMFFFGVFLAVLLPGKWGELSVGFSREYRGEITYSDMIGMTFFLPIFILIQIERNPLHLISYFILSLFYLSLGSRRYGIFVLILGFFIVLSVLKKDFKKSNKRIKMSVLFFAFVGIFYFIFYHFDILEQMFFPDQRQGITTGRFELWGVLFQKFVEHPLVGNGPKLEIPFYLDAQTEAGVTAHLAKFGIFFTGWILYHCIRAARVALKYFFAEEKTDTMLFFSAITIVGIPLYLTDSLESVMSPFAIVFWYGIFFLSFKFKSKNNL